MIVRTDEPIEIRIGKSLIKSSTFEKLLDIKTDNKPNFDTHVKGFCHKKTNKQVKNSCKSDAIRLSKKRGFSWISILMQFNYSLLIWILHWWSNNSKIKHLHNAVFDLFIMYTLQKHSNDIHPWRTFVEGWYSLYTLQKHSNDTHPWRTFVEGWYSLYALQKHSNAYIWNAH